MTQPADSAGSIGAERSRQTAYFLQDLSSRTRLFRQRLMDEFGWEGDSRDQPVFSSYEINEDAEVFKKLLREQPSQLVKFRVMRRNHNVDRHDLDRRTLRVRSKNSLPVYVWARWMHRHVYFSRFILACVVLNSILLAVQADLSESAVPAAVQALQIIDIMFLLTYFMEMLVKWLDSFWDYWKSPWNVFDFVVTVTSAVPELLSLVNSQNVALTRTINKLRVFRALRALKVISQLASLRIIVDTVLTAFKSMFVILILMAVFIFIYAAAGVYLLADYTQSTDPSLLYRDKYNGLGNALISVFNLMTLDAWFKIARDMYLHGAPPVVVVLFNVSWIWIGSFIFKNVFIGVMVKHFELIADELRSQSRKEEREREQRRKKAQLQEALQRMGVQRSTSVRPISRLQRALGLAVAGEPERESAPEYTDPSQWNDTVRSAFDVNSASELTRETTWPRDTLFKYLSLMSTLQENNKEYQELQLMTAWALLQILDS